MPPIDEFMSVSPFGFTAFTADVSGFPIPQQFTFPFYYQPNQLARIACNELMAKLSSHSAWQQICGLSASSNIHDNMTTVGKMFGVLVVKNAQQQLGYLMAYSGQLDTVPHGIAFVPAISDMQIHDEQFLAEKSAINALNDDINAIEKSAEFAQLHSQLVTAKASYQQELLAQQAVMVEGRKQRKLKRKEAEKRLSAEKLSALHAELAGQSIEQKKTLQALKVKWSENIAAFEARLTVITDKILALKKQRKSRSKHLQKKLFSQYKFLNAKQEIKDLNKVFAELPDRTPPAGSGDCAAPKLLQYAYQSKLQPIAMAEFWWGAAPKSAIRHHGQFYPSCYSKCQPILGHMLQGLNVEANPLLINPAQGKDLSVVYQDDDLLVINKPAEFLSVPGKNIEDSVYLRIKNQFPHASGPLIVHRLDMSTSGLLAIALNKRAHKALQKQFIERSVKKRYVAMLNKRLLEDSGVIDLPLRLDLDDKPRQLVCFEHGKKALTHWQVVARNDESTLVHLYPVTGRTHQLRVHCAHPQGLQAPIVGDDHYGVKANRLHLHAEYLAFKHPITKEYMAFEVAADFAFKAKPA